MACLPSQISPMTGFPPTTGRLDTYSAGSVGTYTPFSCSARQSSRAPPGHGNNYLIQISHRLISKRTRYWLNAGLCLPIPFSALRLTGSGRCGRITTVQYEIKKAASANCRCDRMILASVPVPRRRMLLRRPSVSIMADILAHALGSSAPASVFRLPSFPVTGLLHEYKLLHLQLRAKLRTPTGFPDLLACRFRQS